MKPKVTLVQIIWSFLMYKYLGILFILISSDLTAQEIPDYKGEYVFTNSRVSMQGIRELITHNDEGERTIPIKEIVKVKIIIAVQGPPTDTFFPNPATHCITPGNAK